MSLLQNIAIMLEILAPQHFSENGRLGCSIWADLIFTILTLQKKETWHEIFIILVISGHNCEIINVLVGSVLPYVNILLLVRKSQTATYFARNSFITTYYYLHNSLIRNQACKKRDHRNISLANLKKERKKWNTQNFGNRNNTLLGFDSTCHSLCIYSSEHK